MCLYLENGCLLTLLWKVVALSSNELNNATQFGLAFIFKDIVVPAINRCGIDQKLLGRTDVLWRNHSCLRNGIEAEPCPKSAGTVQYG